MDHLIYARAQMGLSLGFHMIFAAVGVALPLFMVLADVMHLRTGDPDYLEFSKRMAKGTAILFAVGAVSGTVLSFELGLLWPTFMGTFGDVIGLPFGMEGFAFFTEAIFLGIYLYGRGRISPRLHLWTGVAVAVSGAASAFFVVLVNAAMNQPPADFAMMANGHPAPIDPLRVMFSPPWKHETLHALLSCYQATAFALAGVHAAVLLRHPKSALFRKAFGLTLVVASVTAILQPISGDRAAGAIAHDQPLKFAASEAQFKTEAHAPLHIGGVPDMEKHEVHYGLEIPSGLSFLASHDPSAEVKGLEDYPRADWPPVPATHYAFEVMVGAGSAMALLGVVAAFLAWRGKKVPLQRPFLYAVVACGPLGMIAMEAGWLVTELGRQPWIFRGAMRTKDAVTPFPYLQAPFWTFGLVYLFLGVAVVYLLYNQLRVARLETVPPSSKAGADHVR